LLLNSINKHIQFTLEVGINSTLNFLDLTLSIVENKINFNIFRKPTFTDTVIDNTSNHPISHKHSAFHSMIHRLVTTPLSDNNYANELNIIKLIALNNGYETTLIDRILAKKLKSISIKKYIYNSPPSSNVNFNHQWRRILYINNLSTSCVSKFPSEIKPAYYTNNNLGRILTNAKDTEDILSHSGIYKLSCHDCSLFYIGKTSRNVNTRIKEHLRCLTSSGFSEFADHLIDKDHTFNRDTGVKILHKNSIGLRLNNLEALEIKKISKFKFKYH